MNSILTPPAMALPGEDFPEAGPVFSHRSVLLREAVEWLRPCAGKCILDGTLGGGGHSEALLEAGASVLGVDRDFAALAAASARLEAYGDRFRALYGDFRNAHRLAAEAGLSGVDGVLLDLGVSSHQLDTAERGFSFQQDGPLDMRMDTGAAATAADLVNALDEEELERIFRDYGGESGARRAARAIVRARSQTPITTTLQLAAVVEGALPRRGPKHPATKIFQSLRIVVNDELGALREALSQLTHFLNPGGRLVVITFHSLEDRIVKQFFRHHAAAELDDPSWPAPRPNPEHDLTLPMRHSIEASGEELAANSRARSARLRVAEKMIGGPKQGKVEKEMP